MTPPRTPTLDPDGPGLDRAADILRAGGTVAFPTETVYGLGADARRGVAVAAIFEAKGRPRFNPLIVHLPDVAAAARIAVMTPAARALAAAFWPGPLSLVLPLRPEAGLSDLVTAGLDSVAVRVPAHPVAQGLLRAFGGPLAAPSANPSGRVSPTNAAHVLWGWTAGSTRRRWRRLRGRPRIDDPVACRAAAGAAARRRVPAERIAAHLGAMPDRPGADDADGPARPQSPGQLASHYAPRGAVRLDATEARRGEILLGFGPVPAEISLSRSGDLREAAARLFECLHLLDARGARHIAVAPIPDEGLGAAINDRLRRAAAPRD